MAETHDYPTRTLPFGDLNPTHVLVGDCGGLSAVLGEALPLLDTVCGVLTEHGLLVAEPTQAVNIYDEEGNPP